VAFTAARDGMTRMVVAKLPDVAIFGEIALGIVNSAGRGF